MTDPKLERAVTQIMMLTKGWRPQDMQDDLRDHREYQLQERRRIRAIIRREARRLSREVQAKEK